MCGGFGKPKGRRRWPELVRKGRLKVSETESPSERKRLGRREPWTVVVGPRLTFSLAHKWNYIIRPNTKLFICITQTGIFIREVILELVEP